MTTTLLSIEERVIAALSTVLDPELDEPVTELGFVRTVTLDDDGVEVHLRLPTAFCSPNFAYLMVSDAYDALEAVPGIGRVRVVLDEHHDSDKINAGTAAGLGYVGTFGSEAETSLDELRLKFQRKAHLAAMERCCRAMLTRNTWTLDELPLLELLDLPEGSRERGGGGGGLRGPRAGRRHGRGRRRHAVGAGGRLSRSGLGGEWCAVLPGRRWGVPVGLALAGDRDGRPGAGRREAVAARARTREGHRHTCLSSPVVRSSRRTSPPGWTTSLCRGCAV